MKPKAILAYCREKGIRTIDLRYADLDGRWLHITLPSQSLSEGSFEEGFGQEIGLDRNSGEYPFSIVVPLSEANYLDSSTEPPTLVLIGAIHDFLHRQESSLDSRHVAIQSLRFLESTSIADDVSIRSQLRFRLVPESSRPLDDSFDEEFPFRCQLMDRALDAGINGERHLQHPSGCSEIVLQPSKLLEACDDICMTRYLINQLAHAMGRRVDFVDQWSSSQWKFIRNGEPIFAGHSARGVSDLGRYAQAGIARHAATLTAIFLVPHLQRTDLNFPYCKNASPDSPQSLTRSVQDSQSLRSRVVEFRGIPTFSNPYLCYAAIIMAMIDGILNKWNPPSGQDAMEHLLTRSTNGTLGFARLLEEFNKDWDFLSMGGVFGEELLEAIRSRLQSAAGSS